MKKKSRKYSLWGIVILGVLAIIFVLVARSSLINADKSDSFYFANALKIGENKFIATQDVDLSRRIIGINGSLITIDEAKRRQVIKGVFDEAGRELFSTSLLVANSSFIINVQDISASPALYLEGIR